MACHNPSYVDKYDIVEDLKKGGNFLLNCPWDVEELDKRLPGKVKKFIADNDINFYTIDGIKIGKEIGLGGRINTILQAAFFKIANIIPDGRRRPVYEGRRHQVLWPRRARTIVAMNHAAIDRGVSDVHEGGGSRLLEGRLRTDDEHRSWLPATERIWWSTSTTC